jgi:hypothetical protein
MKKANIKTLTIAQNTTIRNDGFNSLYIKNFGKTSVTVFDGIPLAQNAEYHWRNDSDVIITDDINISFDNNLDCKMLLCLYYIQ